MSSEKGIHNNRIVIDGVARAAEKDISFYYDYDIDSFLKLYASKHRRTSSTAEKTSINSFIEEQLKLGLDEETIKRRVNSYLRTLNHNRRVQKNNEEKEVFARLEKRLSFEEKAIEIETVAALFKSIPGALPSGVTPETLDAASKVYAESLLQADPKDQKRFYKELDDLLYAKTLMLNAAIIFRKCIDMEVTNMISEGKSKAEITAAVKKRIDDYHKTRKVPYSQETISRAIVLAKIDNLETGIETYVEESEYVRVEERLKFIRMTIKRERNLRREELTRGNKK